VIPVVEGRKTMIHPAVHALKEVADRLSIGVNLLKNAKTDEEWATACSLLAGLTTGVHLYVTDTLKELEEHGIR
jgi:hypothetical protein